MERGLIEEWLWNAGLHCGNCWSDEAPHETHCPACIIATREWVVRWQAEEIARMREILDEATTPPGGEYDFGLRCGVEDMGITDRYDAVAYGWDQAFQYANSVAVNAFPKDTPDAG